MYHCLRPEHKRLEEISPCLGSMLDLDSRPVSMVGEAKRRANTKGRDQAAQHYPIEVFGQSFTVLKE